MHDGSSLRLRKLEQEYDPTDKIQAVRRLMESHAKGDVLTGVFYINAKAPSFIDMLNVTDEPLATLPESVVRPSREVLAKCMEEHTSELQSHSDLVCRLLLGKRKEMVIIS